MGISTNIINSIYDILIADSGISGDVGGRIYQVVAAQKAASPYVVLNYTPGNTYSFGTSGNSFVIDGELQIDVYSNPDFGISNIRDISEDIHELVKGYTFTASGINGAHICHENGVIYASPTLTEEYYQATSIYKVGGNVEI